MSNDTQVQALMKLVVRWASTGREADQIALESALRDAPQQAEGWVMVPVEPDETMEAVGDMNLSCGAPDVYRAMLAARPSAPTAVKPDERAKFEAELRKQCFQKPTPEAYDLAWCMWQSRASKGTK